MIGISRLTTAITVASLLAALSSVLAAEEAQVTQKLLVVVNGDSEISEVTTHELRRLFLGKTGTVRNRRAEPVRSKDESVHNIFRGLVLEMSAKEERTYWLKGTF